MKMFEYDGIEYRSASACRRAALYAWCEQYGDTVGEQAVYINRHLDKCATEMAREWEMPCMVKESYTDPLVCEEMLLDFIEEQEVFLV